ncbi:glycosyltransferase family 2 protein [Granulicella sp. dw_53]|uniref:glycosyltransferase n=1 Tax=Granulicella sp. dw_53 TaxID=2719792 RepID=UPI001BD463B1|nr:glycosyltransferase family 2 protein [Granulicella sp. dw_53]
MSQISVIVPAYNEASHLEKCLQALANQSLSEFEVVVIDNGSTDHTPDIAKTFMSTLNLKVLSKQRESISAARNYGASLSKGAIVAFLDADCEPQPDWLENGIKDSTQNAVWGAHYRIPENSTWVGKIWNKYQATEQEGEVSFLPGGTIFIHRSDFESLGGFSEVVETSEDVDLCTRARDQRMSVLAYKNLSVVHDGTPRTLVHFYRQNRWHGRHVARNFLENLPSTKNIAVVALSAYTLLMFWIFILSLFLLFTGNLWLQVSALILLFLPPLALSVSKARASMSDTTALFVLYSVYALARAAALTNIKKDRSR